MQKIREDKAESYFQKRTTLRNILEDISCRVYLPQQDKIEILWVNTFTVGSTEGNCAAGGHWSQMVIVYRGWVFTTRWREVFVCVSDDSSWNVLRNRVNQRTGILASNESVSSTRSLSVFAHVLETAPHTTRSYQQSLQYARLYQMNPGVQRARLQENKYSHLYIRCCPLMHGTT